MPILEGIAVVSHQAGFLELVVATHDRGASAATIAYHSIEISPSGGESISRWIPIGQERPWALLHAGPALVRNTDGRLEAVAIGNDLAVWHAQQEHPSSHDTYPPPRWTGWQSLDRPGGKEVISKPAGGRPPDPTPVLVANADGRLEVFVVRNDLTVWHRWQDADGHWSDWHSLKRPGEGTPGPLAVATHFDGNLHLFTNDLHGAIWHCWQTHPGWSSWTSLGTPGSHRARSGPVPVNRQNSDPELFVVAEDGTLRHCWQIRYNDKEFGWSGWESLGSQGSGLAEIAVAANADRRLVVFATEPENGNDLWQREEISPEGGWSPWLSRASSLRLDRTETGPIRGPRLILEPTHQLLRLFLQVSSLNYPGEGGLYDMEQPKSPTENWSGGIFAL